MYLKFNKHILCFYELNIFKVNIYFCFLQAKSNELLKVRVQRELYLTKQYTTTFGYAPEMIVAYVDVPGPALSCSLYRLIHSEEGKTSGLILLETSFSVLKDIRDYVVYAWNPWTIQFIRNMPFILNELEFSVHIKLGFIYVMRWYYFVTLQRK